MSEEQVIENEVTDQVEEGEVIEVEIPEEKPTGKIADLARDESVIEDNSETPEVKQEDELVDYSDKVKKRINNLTRKLREAERGQESAYEYAKRVAAENQSLKTRTSNLDRSYLSEATNRLKSLGFDALAAAREANASSVFPCSI